MSAARPLPATPGIIDVAILHTYATGGWDSLNHGAVASMAGISPGEVSLHYPDRQQLGLPILHAHAETFAAYVHRLIMQQPRRGFRVTVADALQWLQTFCLQHADMLRAIFPQTRPGEPATVWREMVVGPFLAPLVQLFTAYRHVLPARLPLRLKAEELAVDVIALSVFGAQEPYCLHEHVRSRVATLRLVGPEVEW